MKRTKKPKPPLVCAFGTEWLDHFHPPIGTGKGCPWCAMDGASTMPWPLKKEHEEQEVAR